MAAQLLYLQDLSNNISATASASHTKLCLIIFLTVRLSIPKNKKKKTDLQTSHPSQFSNKREVVISRNIKKMVCPRIGDSLRKMSPFLMCWIINCYRAELKCFQLQWSISIEHNLQQKKLTQNLEAQHCIQLSNNSLVQFFRKLLKIKQILYVIELTCPCTLQPASSHILYM